MANVKKIKKQLDDLRTKSDPRFRASLKIIADELESMVDAQVAGGAKGGKMRAKSLSKKRRSEIARKAAQVRWAKK